MFKFPGRLPILLPAIVAAAAFFYTIYPIPHSFFTSSLPSKCPLECTTSAGPRSQPHHSSWNSWWHPERSRGVSLESQVGAGTTTDDWNILYHLGGNGPWIEKITDVVEGGVAVPEDCVVEQVHMISRHAERYPTRKHGQVQKTVINRMKMSGKTFEGSLAFLNDWKLFWSDDDDLEHLTGTGPFSGTLSAFTTGVRLRTRYQHLVSNHTSSLSGHPLTIWASKSHRVVKTALHFALGFFSRDHGSIYSAQLTEITEDSSAGANTLTPGRTCLINRRDTDEGQARGLRKRDEYRATYTPPIRQRLREQTGMTFRDEEIYAMQEMCGFETLVRGYSDWCNVFTRHEFLAFEYARDVLHYYRAGPGNKYAATMGWLWLNATTNLLGEGPKAGPFFLSFVHDGDIAPMLTALDVVNDEEDLPTTHIRHNRKWRLSQISPMSGRIIFELLSCATDRPAGVAKFVRLNINDGITALPDCNNGPGKSCPLEQFAARTKNRGLEVGDFKEVCELDENAADRIMFLHQPAQEVSPEV
ncbi:phosphoglycerate mutase-like protein [Plenodomus tracheiphilus IPT5]|uniref:Phosphoglycerate mutase-like protein n=1 Tax=Plenodomus tracheiphilus IPT5 TaxID=1408161 RepID=A0A6A7AXD4_9PLEO|nr:phosphoglycerate mutase-like protein [Plenodomus tracheiphilus IPT5]